MSEIEKLYKEFLDYLEIEKGSSLKTRENYERYLTRFLKYSKIKKVKDIDAETVRGFRLWLNRQPNAPWKSEKKFEEISTEDEHKTLSRKTQNYYLIALRMFLKYLTKRNIKCMPADQIELAKIPSRSLEDLITKDELMRIFESAEGDGLKSLRDRAILELLFSTGLRVTELCSLPRDINIDSPELSVRGKGAKVRVVFISSDARQAVKKYLAKRTDMEDALFVRLDFGGKNKKRELRMKSNLDRHSIERIVRHYARKAGVSKKVTPHTMRHLFATDLLSNGADIRSVQALLGHSSIITTQIYTHVTDKHLEEIHKKFHNRKQI